MQDASDVAARSVGEKASPLPWLSSGASLMISLPEARCLAVVLNSPEYITFEVAIVLLSAAKI